MRARLASAPVSFGVWERTVERGDLVPAERLVDAVCSLGYDALELGPPGYLGADAAAVRERLERRGLALAGAFCPLRLADEAAFAADLAELERTLGLLAGWPEAVCLLADVGSPERARVAGRPAELARTTLAGAELRSAAGRLARAAERCAEAGLPAALHPEAGGYVEAPAEVAAFLELVEPELLGLCLDTGHALVGGGDPVELAEAYASRIRHVHLKDVDGALLARVRAGELDLDAAWDAGIFCPFGRGSVDLAAVLAALGAAGYRGRLVLEQDRVAVTGEDLERVRAEESANRAFICDLLAAPVQAG